MSRRGLVLYPAFEQSFFVDSIVLLLFRAEAHSRRLHSALDRHTGPHKESAPSAQRCRAPYRGPASAECITRHWQAVMGAAECHHSTRLRTIEPWSKANRGPDDYVFA
jgi:hypothetical protein